MAVRGRAARDQGEYAPGLVPVSVLEIADVQKLGPDAEVVADAEAGLNTEDMLAPGVVCTEADVVAGPEADVVTGS